MRSRSSVIIGFDGFVDRLSRVIDDTGTTRPHGGPDAFVGDIVRFAERVARAAGGSDNLRLHDLEQRPGGNAPNTAAALATLGVPTTLLAAVGEPGHAALHPAFGGLGADASAPLDIRPISQPGETQTLEFDGARLNLNRAGPLAALHPDAMPPGETLRGALVADPLIAAVNWTLCPTFERLLAGLLAAVPGGRRVFLELSAAAARPAADLAAFADWVRAAGQTHEITFGVNRAEAQRLGDALSLAIDTAAPRQALDSARALREALGVARVALHVRAGSAVVTAGDAAWAQQPPVRRAVLQTGAGDHYNAGLIAGLLAAEPAAALARRANATAAAFVSTGRSPTAREVAAFADV